MVNRWGKCGNSERSYFGKLQNQCINAATKLKYARSLEESYDEPRQSIKKKRHHFANKGPSSKSYGFSTNHVWMWGLDYKESWALKNWCFWTVVLEKTPESPLDSKEIKPVNPKGNQPWVFIGGTEVEAETPILWPPDAKSWLIWKDPDAGRKWGQEDRGRRRIRWLNGVTGFVWTLGVGDGQGGLACCGSWGHKELDMTEWLNWLTEKEDRSWEFSPSYSVLSWKGGE